MNMYMHNMNMNISCMILTKTSQEFQPRNHPPVKLVVFDFDETLTMATFMPRSKAITTKAGKRAMVQWVAHCTLFLWIGRLEIQRKQSSRTWAVDP